MLDLTLSLQDQFAPNLKCFGCGPANEKGLQIKSFAKSFDDGDKVVCEFQPEPHQIAFEGMVNGGIIGALLDCHLHWTSAWHLIQKNGSDKPPCCVTAKYEVTFLAPTPIDSTLHLIGWVNESSERKAIVEGTLGPEGEITAKCVGTFVAVKPGHPAYHRF